MSSPLDNLVARLFGQPKAEKDLACGGRDFCVFLRQFSTLLRANVDLRSSLEILAEQYQLTDLGRISERLCYKVSTGHRLSNAMNSFPKTFDKLVTAMVKVGEETGELDEALDKVSEWKEREQALVSKVKSALAYPVLILIVSAIVTWLLFTYIVPVFLDMFVSLNVELPAVTKLALNISYLLGSPLFWLCLSVLGVFVYSLFRHQWATEEGRAQLFAYLHQIPVIGEIIRIAAITRFAGALQRLLTTGLDIRRSLNLAAQGSGNPLMIITIRELTRRMAEGELPSEFILARPELFTSTFGQYYSSGEESAQLPELLGAAHNFFEEELHGTIDTAVALIEPIVMLIVGCIIGFVIISVASSTIALIQ